MGHLPVATSWWEIICFAESRSYHISRSFLFMKHGTLSTAVLTMLCLYMVVLFPVHHESCCGSLVKLPETCTIVSQFNAWQSENQGALQGPLGGKMGWNKVVRLKMTSEGRVSLRLADVKRYGVQYFGRSDVESASTKWKVVSRNRK